MITEQIPTTQNTLYSRFANAPRFGSHFKFYTLAKSLGYPYFEWNERVFKINYTKDEPACERLDVTYQNMIEAGV